MTATTEGDITALYPMVRNIARRFPPCAGHDDLTQIGMEAVHHASRRYDPSRGTTFAAYAHRRAWGAMQDHVRTENHTRAVVPVRLVSLDAPAESGDRFEELLRAPDVEPDPFLRAGLVDAIAGLPERKRQAVGLTLEGYTQREVARMLGVTESSVSYWLRDARAAIAAHPAMEGAL